jgi:hypothetical protein
MWFDKVQLGALRASEQACRRSRGSVFLEKISWLSDLLFERPLVACPLATAVLIIA